MLLDAAKATTSHSSSYIILIYIAVFAFAYFFYLRPRSRKQKAARMDTKKVEVGDRAQTIGGFVGTVVKSSSDLITLRTDGGVELDFVPSAIARKYNPVVPESADDHPTEGDAK
jgi:preprotein translocase YajC subunit